MSSAPPDIEETLPRRAPAGRRQGSRDWSALFVAFCCDDPLQPPSRHLLEGISSVRVGRGARRAVQREGGELSLALRDGWASASHARLIRDGVRFRLEDAGSRNGVRVNGRSVREATLEDGDLIEVGHTLMSFRRYAGEAPSGLDLSPRGGSLGEPERPDFVTLCPGLERDLADAFHVAESSELSLLVEGESGSGKEVLASSLAARSHRSGPFVPVNCGAIVPGLVESELFGHVRGAFTGAESSHDGLIRSAHRGTLFLDEIGDLELGAQAALLRVLQEREVRPVGSTRSVAVDVRLLSATHRDLDSLAREGAFRDDLLARLSGFRVRLPPLRERREDLGLLVATLLRQRGEASSAVRFEPDAALRLFRYHWPLNVRELSNALTAACVLAREGVIAEHHLSPAIREAKPPSPPRSVGGAEGDASQREALVRLFRQHHGNVSAVARDMGKARTQIQRWVKRFGLNPRDFQE